MHLGEISFCDRIGFNIKSDDIKKKILDDLESINGFKVIQKHFDRFDANISPSRINTIPHIVSLRSNGNPYLLYLTKYNYENQCIFIDKKIQHGYFYPRMILSKLWFDPSIFNDTLLDGEMVKTNTGDWHFIINDIMCLNGQSLDRLNIVKRVAIVYDILEKQYFDDDFNCCRLFVKKYVTMSQIDQLVNEFLPTLPYTCRGIYFKPFYLKFKDILANFDDTLVQKVVRFKYKHIDGETFKSAQTSPPRKDQVTYHEAPAPQPQITTNHYKPQLTLPTTPPCKDQVTFYVKKTSNVDIYELYSNDHDDKCHSVALVNTLKTSKMMKEIFRDVNLTDKLAMTCVYCEKFSKYCPQSLSSPK